ncbi:MAG TPA: BON domain-containing protein [Nitrospirales bacterium]|nr:BON domain-containing protein [Nitrospirales bacterium]
MPDEQLSSAIKERVKWDGRIKAEQNVIDVENGNVMLSGVVDTVTELSLAEGLVDGSIIGVKLVVKNITVRPAVSQDDANKQQIDECLKNIPAH